MLAGESERTIVVARLLFFRCVSWGSCFYLLIFLMLPMFMRYSRRIFIAVRPPMVTCCRRMVRWPAKWHWSLLLCEQRRVRRWVAESPSSWSGQVHVRQLRVAVWRTVAWRQAYRRGWNQSHRRSVLSLPETAAYLLSRPKMWHYCTTLSQTSMQIC